MNIKKWVCPECKTVGRFVDIRNDQYGYTWECICGATYSIEYLDDWLENNTLLKWIKEEK